MQFNPENVFNHLKEKAASNTQFHMNVSEYKGRRVALFDYSLTVPDDFAGHPFTRESRGSVFEIDENDNFVSVLCLPYEKFFNLGEYDWGRSDLLRGEFVERYGIEPSENIVQDFHDKHGSTAYFLDKMDGSIISFFDLDGELDAKSNSSLTSDYKEEAMSWLDQHREFKEKIETLCHYDWTVIVEYTSFHPSRQIVIPYTEAKLTVTGARNRLTGEYMRYDALANIFTEDELVTRHWDVSVSDYEAEGIEGYILVIEEFDIRVKLKTQWYIERHRVATDLSNKQAWRLFLDDKIDDVYDFIPEPRKEYFDHLLGCFRDIIETISRGGKEYHDKYQHLDVIEFFKIIKQPKHHIHDILVSFYAAKCYKGGEKYANDELIKQLGKQKTISSLGISEIGLDFYLPSII